MPFRGCVTIGEIRSQEVFPILHDANQLCLARRGFCPSGNLQATRLRFCNTVATMAENDSPRKNIAALAPAAFVGAVILVAGLVTWGLAPTLPPAQTSIPQVEEIIKEIEQEQDLALSGAEDYINFLRDRNFPGVFNYDSPSWQHAESFYRAHWDINNLKSFSEWFKPDTQTITEVSGWVLPETECSSPFAPGDEPGVEVFAVRDRGSENLVHYIGIKDGRGFVFSPLCNLTPPDRIAEARAALEDYLAREAQAKQEGPKQYFEFVRENNYPDLYDTTTARWRLGEAIITEVWESQSVFLPDQRDLDSIGILDVRFAPGREGCAPTRLKVPAAMWVVTTPARGGKPYAEYFQYHEGNLYSFVALCDIKASVNERGEVIIASQPTP